jgi:phospholipid transport system substrate-binding protein
MRMPSAAIAEANFDFADMARTTLGDHWRKITPQQQAQFVPLLTSFMENVYLRKLQEYSVQKVRQDVNASNISFIEQRSNGPGYAEVHSSVLLKDRPTPVKVDYLLRQDGAQWRFYDLNIDAIS